MRKPPMQQPPIKKTTKLKDDVFVATNQKEIGKSIYVFLANIVV
jgi:hypothetical protein